MSLRSHLGDNNEIIESWVRLFTESLFNWAFFKTSDKEVAEDLVQDTFLAAKLQFENFKNKSSPKTWLFAILNNKIKDYYRYKYKQNAEINHEIDGSIFSQVFNHHDRWKEGEKPLKWDDDEEHLLDNSDFNQVLATCFDHLPEHWRLIVNLKFIEEKKGEDICQEMNVSATNFWQILHRAKLQLRKCLEIKWFKL